MSQEVDFLYSDLDDALTQLARRRADGDFCRQIDDLFGVVPEPMRTLQPKTVFARYVASPTLEFDSFYQQARKTNLEPLLLEFAADKLVARNLEKYCLCRMSFIDENHPTKAKSAVKNIINFNTDEGKPLNSIRTVSGELLTDFHHRLMQKHLGGKSLEIYDFSDWFIPSRGIERWSYYLRYLSLFLCRGILFENFLMDRNEASFTTEVVIPAFRTIQDITGQRPLIVRAIPATTENEPYWCYYDKNLQDFH